VAVSADGRLLATVGVSRRALQLRDADSLRSLGTIDVGVGPTHLVALGRRFFVVDTRGNALLQVLTSGGLRIHRRIDLPGTPYGIAYDPVRRRIWVTLTATNQVVELSDRHRLRAFPTVRQPNSVAVDTRTGRVFVASRADGTLQSFLPSPLHDGRR
jgi:DNA-binding beta-propeller fold protein YncE